MKTMKTAHKKQMQHVESNMRFRAIAQTTCPVSPDAHRPKLSLAQVGFTLLREETGETTTN